MNNGINYWTPGDGVVHVRFVDSESDVLTDVMNPTRSSINDACIKHDLETSEIWKLTQDPWKATHTIFIDVVQYKEHQNRQGLSDNAYQLALRLEDLGFNSEEAIQWVKEIVDEAYNRGLEDGKNSDHT